MVESLSAVITFLSLVTIIKEHLFTCSQFFCNSSWLLSIYKSYLGVSPLFLITLYVLVRLAFVSKLQILSLIYFFILNFAYGVFLAMKVFLKT